MINTIIFDLDGTLLDTLIDLNNAVNFGLQSCGFPSVSVEHTRISIGNGTTMLMKRSTPKDTPEDIQQIAFDKFSEHYNIHFNDNTYVYKGVLEVLLKLKADGFKLAVISNKLHDKANWLMNYHLPNIFDAVQGTYLDKPKKPNPYVTNLLFKTLSIDGSNALYVGDTEVDKECAINGNMDFLLVGYGYRTPEELRVKCPNEKITLTPYDLYKDIKDRIKKKSA